MVFTFTQKCSFGNILLSIFVFKYILRDYLEEKLSCVYFLIMLYWEPSDRNNKELVCMTNFVSIKYASPSCVYVVGFDRRVNICTVVLEEEEHSLFCCRLLWVRFPLLTSANNDDSFLSCSFFSLYCGVGMKEVGTNRMDSNEAFSHGPRVWRSSVEVNRKVLLTILYFQRSWTTLLYQKTPKIYFCCRHTIYCTLHSTPY